MALICETRGCFLPRKFSAIRYTIEVVSLKLGMNILSLSCYIARNSEPWSHPVRVGKVHERVNRI